MRFDGIRLQCHGWQVQQPPTTFYVFVTLIQYPKQPWWPLHTKYATKSLDLIWKKSARGVFMVPSRQGWVPHHGIAGKLRAFALFFNL